MSIFKKITLIILSFTLILSCFVGCGEKHTDAIIYFELIERPQTLDPQTASSDSELLIVRNIYEGLLRKSEDGTIIGGISESYSYENLTYTFNLKDNAVWSNGEAVTAYDFECGFRRAIDPKIKAPFASRLFAITNAEAINSGSADVSALGVKAIDDKTFTITLCREDNDFLETLTTSVCMPCNQEFFDSSIGKYGRDAENIISNGSYRLTKWNKEDFGIRLYKNEEYSGVFDAQNAAVFISCIDEENQVSRVVDGDSDMAFLPCSELDTAGKAQLKTDSVQNICWIMTLSRNYSSDVRRAFAMAFNNDVYKQSLPNGFIAAKSIYPAILGVNTDGLGLTGYDIAGSKAIMSGQVALLPDSKFPQSTLYYYNSDGIKGLATAIVGHWQQNLSTFINIEGSDNLAALRREIGENDLDFAIFPITAKSSSFSEYAINFSSVSTATTPDVLQQELLSDNNIIPVAYQTTNISYIQSLEKVVMEDDNGYIDFSFIVKR